MVWMTSLSRNWKLFSFIVFSVAEQPNIACFIVSMLPSVDLKEDYNINILHQLWFKYSIFM